MAHSPRIPGSIPGSTPARTLDADRYAQTFAVFVPRSGEYAAMGDRLDEQAQACPPGFCCLDIGAGTGLLIRDWVARGRSRPGRYVAVEPNPAHARQLRQSLAGLDLDSRVIEAPFAPGDTACGATASGGVASGGVASGGASGGGYDLVLFSHSLYWLDDPVGCVQEACGLLNPGGRVVVFIQSPFGIHPLFRLFDPLLDRDRPTGPDHGLSSHELIQGLRAAGLEPRVTFDPTPIDLTGLFDPGPDARHRLDEFLSFCLQIEFAGLAEPLRSDIVAYLQAAGVRQQDRLLWFEPTATVVVR